MQLRGKVPLQKEAVLELLAERYGWTYNEIKSLPLSEFDALMQIIKTKQVIQEKDAKRKAYGK